MERYERILLIDVVDRVEHPNLYLNFVHPDNKKMEDLQFLVELIKKYKLGETNEKT